MNIEIEILLDICREAGAAIMDVYRGDIQVDTKQDKSPLTDADRASHNIIVKRLKEHFPEIPILSEEGRDISFEARNCWEQFWLVDPLDGTKEFIKKNGEFTVNIALIEENRPVLGVIYVPAKNLLYWGGEKQPAMLQTGFAPPRPIQVRKADPQEGLTVVMSRSHPSPELQNYLTGIRVADKLPTGSSLKFCVVAEGRADLYPRLGSTMEWDIAAGHAILEAAGGQVRKVDGGRLVYNKRDLLNPHFIASGRM